MDLFDSKNIKPMLLSEIHEPFDSPEYIFELKLDGIRSILYIDANYVEIRNKRNMRLNTTYPELLDIHRQIKRRCILDGELVIMKDGIPDFYELQRRSMMRNPTKIEFAMNRLPVSFTAFDILYIDNEQITDRLLLERKDILQDIVIENERFAVTRYIPNMGISLYNLTVQQDLEGIVAKRKESKYYLGKTTKDWVKIKNLKDEDFVICGYIEKPNNMVSLILGAYKNGRLIGQGHVTLGVSGSAFEQINKISKIEHPLFDNGDEHTVWIEPILVCTVKYMMKTEKLGMRQPIFKGIREDKMPQDCTV